MWKERRRWWSGASRGGDYGRLPIERPTKIDLVLIMKTAKAPGLSIQQELLLSANEVIE